MTETAQQAPELGLPADNAAVIKHMDMYQGIITRLAGNSAGCKNFAIPLITAILGFIVVEKQIALVWLSILPIVLFYLVDCYYLVLENQFREAYNHDAKKIQLGNFSQKDLFNLNPFKAAADFVKDEEIADFVAGEEAEEKRNKEYLKRVWEKSLKSISTLPVYAGLLFLVAVAYLLIDLIKP